MKICVATCQLYSDTWAPFFGLMNKFWPNRSWKTWLLTDRGECSMADNVFRDGAISWCGRLTNFVDLHGDEPILLLQDDFFLTQSPVEDLIRRGLEFIESGKASMVRLYPCPGADEDFGDEFFGIVNKEQRYRISCQASIWRTDFLYSIASKIDAMGKPGTASWFELHGTELSSTLPGLVLALKREAPHPWPIEYLVTAIVRGAWTHAAKALCDQEAIVVDWSKRRCCV